MRHVYVATNPFSKVKNIKVPQRVIRPVFQDDVVVVQKVIRICMSDRVGHFFRPRGQDPGGFQGVDT